MLFVLCVLRFLFSSVFRRRRRKHNKNRATKHRKWTVGAACAGIVMGLIDDIPDCKTLLDNIVAEAEEVIGRMPKVVVSKL